MLDLTFLGTFRSPLKCKLKYKVWVSVKYLWFILLVIEGKGHATVSDTNLGLVAPDWGWRPRPGAGSVTWSEVCRSSGAAGPSCPAPWTPRWCHGRAGAPVHCWPFSVPSLSPFSVLETGPHHRCCYGDQWRGAMEEEARDEGRRGGVEDESLVIYFSVCKGSFDYKPAVNVVYLYNKMTFTRWLIKW